MWIIHWWTKYDDGEEVFFSEAQVRSFIKKRKNIFTKYTINKV